MKPTGEKGSKMKDMEKKLPDDDDSDSDQDDTEGNKQTMTQLLARFAERTSLQGVQYIHISKTWYAKLLWTLFFCGGMAGMVVHLSVLCGSYLNFAKQTKIQLEFDSIKFPAITLCNVNPVKLSKLNIGNQEFREFVTSIRPENEVNSIKEVKTNQNIQPSGQRGDLPPRSTTSSPSSRESGGFRSRTKRSGPEMERDPPGNPSSAQATINEVNKEFRFFYSSHDRETRIKLGHELKDMLVSCSFSGNVCNVSHFSIHPTSAFGNCYTLESDDNISYKSGPVAGLEVVLLLEVDEYIDTIASGTGAQVQIHDRNTWPDPEAEGLAVSAAMETNIAMRMIQVERLNWPNDDCDYGAEFEARYGRKYTQQSCHRFCILEEIVSQCGCYGEETSESQRSINTDEGGNAIPPCTGSRDVKCMLKVEIDWESGEFQCPCRNPCRQNFMKINIYFEDLNFEVITEARGYEDVQFASDVGGTVGLWVGITLLSIMEVLQFFAEILEYIYEKLRKMKKVNHESTINTDVPNDNRVHPLPKYKDTN